MDTLSRERWCNLVEPLFDAALELEPADRAAFLDEACQGDRSLHDDVSELLRAFERTEGFLVSPAAVAHAPLLAMMPPEIPRQLGGHYTIVREIGQGGMATVYLADDAKHARQVAVKVLHGDVERIIGRERFLREIEIAAGLSHPHILPLYDSGDVPSGEDDTPPFLYFVTPFVTGESLRERLDREPRPTLAETIRIGSEIAVALDYAHRQGVIHLDVKPGNILLHDGHAIIADFGIARAISSAGDTNLTRTTPVLGTPAYMSPEQVRSPADVDGRSDIYSLGCVLYEMITGERAFARATPADALRRAHADAVPDRKTLEQHSSPELASVVLRAMAPARDDRFPTAGALADALRTAAQAKPRAPRRAWVLGGAVAATIAAAAAGFWATQREATLDANLIAVAPFDVEAPSLSLWKEGMVDVISRNLDGAGPLRAVPATVVVRQWRGRGDAQSAAALGRRTGARLVLFGGMLASRDSVRATAVLLDASTGRTLAEIEQRDDSASVDRLSDSLTVAVLRELGRFRRIDMARATSSPTTSLAALKAYLQGEHFYRAALLDSAESRFERALRIDTTFALAYHRLASIRMWRDPRQLPDSATFALMRRASYFPRGLGPRELLLARVDSLAAEASFARRRGSGGTNTGPGHEIIVRQLLATLDSAMHRYPNDPELTFILADTHSRYGSDVVFGEVDDRATLALFDRAIGLDSSFALPYMRPMALAAFLDGPESARRYIRAYLSVAAPDSQSTFIRLAAELFDPSRGASINFARLVDTLPTDMLCQFAGLLRHLPDSAQAAVQFARALAARSAPGGLTSNYTCAVLGALAGMQFRGHLRDAHRMTSLEAHWVRPIILYNMARAGMIPVGEARAEFKRILALAPRTRMPKLYAWWASDGDTLAIQTYIDGFSASLITTQDATNRAARRADIAAGRAYLALAKGDTVAAIRQLSTTPDTLHECWYDHRLTLARLLVATGQHREAAVRLERRWPGTSTCSNGFDDVMWTLERARAFERLGRRDDARANYAFVVDAWRTADVELQRYVREAREGVTRLAVGKR